MKVNLAATLSGAAWRPSRIARLSGFALLAAFCLLHAGGASAQGVSRGKDGDWETRCDKPPGAQEEVCSIMQFVSAEDRPNVGLAVVALKTSTRRRRSCACSPRSASI